VVFRHPYTSIAEQERTERQHILDHFQVRWEKLPEA
jgi:dCMP deaminase